MSIATTTWASPIVDDSEGTSVRVHLEYLLASGPALLLVLHLSMRCGSRTPGLEFRCRIVLREEGYCVSCVLLGVERVACITSEYLKTSSRNLYEIVCLFVVAPTLYQLDICDGIPFLIVYRQYCGEIYLS